MHYGLLAASQSVLMPRVVGAAQQGAPGNACDEYITPFSVFFVLLVIIR